jgi:hypothetical protein
MVLSSAAGVDLNRCWDKATQQTHPTIFHARYTTQQINALLSYSASSNH